MDNNRKNASVCDDMLIAIRRIIQSIDLHSKHLVKQISYIGKAIHVATRNHLFQPALSLNAYNPGG